MTKNQISIEAKEDFLERLSSASPINALAELIWNGLDAGSDEIDVRLVKNKMDGLEEICVQDKGCGIPYDQVQELFGNLGASWKKNTVKKYGRALHGKDGAGRLKAFALGNRVMWKTTFASDFERKTYQIEGVASALNSLTYTDPMPATNTPTGTQVVISNIEKSHGTLLSDNASHELAKLFAAYLSQYPHVSIILNGSKIDPSGFQSFTKEIQLDPVLLRNGERADLSVRIIEWNISTKRVIHLCDRSGVSLHEIDAGVQAKGFQFTAYIQCDYFRELNKENLLMMDDLHPDLEALVSKGRETIRTHFRHRLAEKQRHIVARWKEEDIYPYKEKTNLTPVEEAERQVFDILGVNLEAYLPRFDEADQSSRKFTFMLLAQALRENPKSVQKIITEVLCLKVEDQESLAALLQNTPLSNIISTAQIVANRLDFLIALENLLFDKDTKEKLLERDQLHKILETESWIFDEQFALSCSEKRLEEVLELHINKLGKRKDDDPVLREGGIQGRIDLMLSRVNQPRHDERDYLIVELKRPSQKINSEILSQVESYAIAVAKDPRFHTDKTRWRFMIVSNEMDDHAKRKAKQRDRFKGLVFDDSELNIEVWAFDWTEIISKARSRLQFINESLRYEADRDSATEYLLKTHKKFIPEIDGDFPDQEKESRNKDEVADDADEVRSFDDPIL